MNPNKIEIKNRKASYEFSFLDKYIAGIQLTGTEIKSIRNGKASINEAYCTFINNELFVLNMNISEYETGSYYNHEPKRNRKLLLNRHELNKIQGKLIDKSITIIPTKLFINEKGIAKLEISVSKGKKLHDKREDIKKKDIERELNRKFN